MSTPRATACRPAVLHGRLGPEDAARLARGFRAIADPARLRLLNFITGQADGEACVCHLTQPLGLAQPTVSHHLKVLTEAGLLRREQRGTWAYYRLVPDRMAALRETLALPGPRPAATERLTPGPAGRTAASPPPCSIRRRRRSA